MTIAAIAKTAKLTPQLYQRHRALQRVMLCAALISAAFDQSEDDFAHPDGQLNDGGYRENDKDDA